MAKENSTREPGRIKQMVQVYKVTKRHDKSLPWTMLMLFLLPIAASILPAALIPNGGIAGWILWPITGVLVGLLLALIVLGRRAEAMAYAQIEGRPGAVGAVLSSGLRRSWRGSEVPVAISPKTQDAVYRAVGKGGVALIGEGSVERLQRLMSQEEAKIKRLLPNVQVSRVFVGTDHPDKVRLAKLPKTLYKLKKALNGAEVQAVHQRLASMQANPIGIPKGIDPMRMRRPGRPR